MSVRDFSVKDGTQDSNIVDRVNDVSSGSPLKGILVTQNVRLTEPSLYLVFLFSPNY